MLLRSSLEVVLTAFFYQTVFGTPVAVSRDASPAQAAEPSVMRRSDRFIDSGVDFDTWTKRMVDEGKMFFPEERTVKFDVRNPNEMETVVVRHPDGSRSFKRQAKNYKFGLTNIACSGLGGNNDSYKKGKEHFCSMLKTGLGSGLGTILKAATYDLTNNRCNGNILCDLLIDLSVQGTMKPLIDNRVMDYACDKNFDELWTKCGSRGGSARFIMLNPRNEAGSICGKPICLGPGQIGTDIGAFQAQFFDHESGWQCPAPKNELVCKKESF